MKDYLNAVKEVVCIFATNWAHLGYPFKEFLKGMELVFGFLLVLISPFLIPVAPIFALLIVNDIKLDRLRAESDAKRHAARERQLDLSGSQAQNAQEDSE